MLDSKRCVKDAKLFQKMFAKYIFLTFFKRKNTCFEKTDELYLRTSSNESNVNYFLTVHRLQSYNKSVTSIYPPDSWDNVIDV